jgi:hypothetical protein
MNQTPDFAPDKVQYVEPNDPTLAVLLTRDGRVFYDLDMLVSQFTAQMMMSEIENGIPDDDLGRGELSGMAKTLLSIRESAQAIRNDAAAHAPAPGKASDVPGMYL